MRKYLISLFSISFLLLWSLLSFAQEVTTSKSQGGTIFKFTFSKEQSQRLSDDWFFALETSRNMLNTINNLEGGDFGVALALRIAKTKIAWDLQSFSNKFIAEGASSWTYVLQRNDNLAGVIVLADQIAKVWRELTSSAATKIVGYADKTLSYTDNMEAAFFAGKDFKVTYPYSGIQNWSGIIEGRGADENVSVKVYIKTNQEYFQGEAIVDSRGNWKLATTYPTKGAKNLIFAKMLKDGVLVAITNEVEVYP